MDQTTMLDFLMSQLGGKEKVLNRFMGQQQEIDKFIKAGRSIYEQALKEKTDEIINLTKMIKQLQIEKTKIASTEKDKHAREIKLLRRQLEDLIKNQKK